MGGFAHAYKDGPRRGPGGERKAPWSPPQRRNLLRNRKKIVKPFSLPFIRNLFLVGGFVRLRADEVLSPRGKVPKGRRGRPKGACGMAAPGPPVAKEQCTASLAGARPARFTSVPGRATVAFGAADPSPGSWAPVYPWSGSKEPPWQGYPAAVRAAAKVPYKVRARYEPCRSRNRGKIGIPLGRRSHPPKEKPFRTTRKSIFPFTAEKQFSPGYGRANSISRHFTPASS